MDPLRRTSTPSTTALPPASPGPRLEPLAPAGDQVETFMPNPFRDVLGGVCALPLDADLVAEACRGGLGALSPADRERLLDRAIAGWLGVDGCGAPRPEELADLVELAAGDPALAQVIGPALHARARVWSAEAVELARSARPGCVDAAHGGEDYDPARYAATLAAASVSAYPDARSLLGSLDAAGAVELVGALAPDLAQLTPERAAAMNRLLEAAALTPPGEASQAILLAAFERTEAHHFRAQPELARGFARAFAAQWPAKDAAGRAATSARLEGVLGLPQAQQALFGAGQSLGARAELLSIIAADPALDRAALAGAQDVWSHPAVLSAHLAPRVAAHQAARGDAGVRLVGSDLDNFVGAAMGLTPSVPRGESATDRELRERAVAEGRRSYFASGEASALVTPVAQALRAAGGPAAEVAVLPISFVSDETGPVELPLFRVRNPDSGVTRFVDNLGRTYADLASWREDNLLPPGTVAFPAGGALAGGAVVVEGTESWAEWGARQTDRAVLAGGTVAAGALVFSSGGVLTPVALGVATLSSGWGAYRSGASLLDRQAHGQSIDPFHDPAARGEWLAFGASALGLASLGGSGLAARWASQGSLSARTALAVGGLNVTSNLAGGAATLDGAAALYGRWDELGGEQRAALALQLGFWGLTAGAAARTSGGGLRGMFDPRATRDALLALKPPVAPPPPRTVAQALAGLPPETAGRLARLEASHGPEAVMTAADAIRAGGRAATLAQEHPAFGPRALVEAGGDAARAEALLRQRVQVMEVNGRLVPPTVYGGTLYHGMDSATSRADLTAIFAEGLPARGDNLDIVNHRDQAGGSAFRGTTAVIRSPDGDAGAAAWAGQDGWVIQVDGVPSWDMNRLLEGVPWADGGVGKNVMQGELESAVAAQIPPERIAGAYPVLLNERTGKLVPGEFIPNPNYRPPQ